MKVMHTPQTMSLSLKQEMYEPISVRDLGLLIDFYHLAQAEH